MLQKIRIANFQKHENLTVELKKGLNVIIGRSDSGKSSIFRAIDFALFNGSKKSNIVRKGKKKAVVEVVWDDHSIIRTKGKKINTYELDGQLFKAFGANTPSEISDVVKMNDINIQRQHDRPFLLSQTSGNVAKYLNKLINIDSIDKIVSSINSQTNSCKKDLEYADGSLTDAKKIVSEYKWIRGFEKRLESLNALDDAITKKETRYDTLNSILEDYDTVSSNISTLPIREIENRVNVLLEGVSELDNKLNLMDKLDDLISSLNNGVIKSISIPKDKIENIDNLIADIGFKKNSVSVLEELINCYNEQYQEVIFARARAEKLEQVTKGKLRELKKQLNVCPTCGQTIPKENK